MSQFLFTPLVQDLPATVPFIGPEAIERQMERRFAARIGANENGFGPSPKARRAIAETAAEAWMYGDPETFELKRALAAHLGVEASRIVVGEGVDGLLGYVARMAIGPGTPIVTSLGAYPTFRFHAAGYGAAVVAAPYHQDRENLDALVEKATRENARLVYLANPDNPMGTWWDAAAIEQALAALPDTCLLCLDEAYIDMAPPEAAPPLALEAPNLLRFRTFSKLHGLAGMRVGYAIGAPEIVRSFDKIRNHFGVGRVAQAAALAALSDPDWSAETLSRIAASRRRIAEIAADNGLDALDSAANFVAIDCGGDGDLATSVVGALGRRGVFVRMPGVAPLNRCIRVSCGPDADMDLFAEALPAALAETRG